LNVAALCLGAGDYTGVDWALDYAQAATIRAALNGFEPGWSKQIWSAVRQTAAETKINGTSRDTTRVVHQRLSGGLRASLRRL
jgi:hypothetical protein